MEIDSSDLPSGVSGLLSLARKVPERAGARREVRSPGLFERAGLLVLVGRGDWILAALLYVLGRIAFSSSLVMYDSLLPLCAE